MDKETRNKLKKMVQTLRARLMQDTGEHLEGVYGLHAQSSFESITSLPELKEDKKAETRRRLEYFFEEEAKTGLKGKEAVDKLIKEIAFTHLNRFVAFKMMETRKIIRQTISRGVDSNAFKFYLVEQPEDERLYNSGRIDEAYQNFLLWQSGRIATEMKVLFDPDNLPSRIFPRPRTLKEILAVINDETMKDIWQEDETIGWVYQYFIEEDKAAVFDKIYKQKKKMALRDIPSATQIFTPKWIVRYLVENTLGRLWLRMHPDSRLMEKMSYYVPNNQDKDRIPLKKAAEITLLDPACGTMHFGMVAFDLFIEMYKEEMANAGKDGWPQGPSCEKETGIVKDIIEKNLFGIDLDLRAIQLSALSLYIKAKSHNKDAFLERFNLTYTDIPPFSEETINAFIDTIQTEHLISKRLLREVLPLLNKAYYLGSLLKIEKVIDDFVEKEKETLGKKQQLRLFPKSDQLSLFSKSDDKVRKEANLSAKKRIVWEEVKEEIISAFQQFIQTHKQASGAFVAGESMKGLGLIDALIRKHDVVVCNPPYSGKRNWDEEIRNDLKILYPKKDGDLYTVFIDRCLDLTTEHYGLCGMITVHSFMFTSSHEEIRKEIINNTVIETMAHLGTRTFGDLSNPNAQGFSMYALGKIPKIKNHDNIGIYFRLVQQNEDEKHVTLCHAINDYINNKNSFSDPYIFLLELEKLKAIPSWPFVYWLSDSLRELFKKNIKVSDAYPVKEGINTGDNFRFVRYWWEIGKIKPPYKTFIKEGKTTRFYDEIPCIIKWNEEEIRTISGSAIRNKNYMYRKAVTFLSLTVKELTAKFTPKGSIFCSTGGRSIFAENYQEIFYILGLLNSKLFSYLLSILNPTVSFTVGDVSNMPLINEKNNYLIKKIFDFCKNAYYFKRQIVNSYETSKDYLTSRKWQTGHHDLLFIEKQLAILKTDISEAVYQLYEIEDADIQQIESEFGALPGKLPKIEGQEPRLKRIETLYLEKHVPDEVIQKANQIIEADNTSESATVKESTKKRGRQKRFLTFEELCLASGFHPETVYNYIVENKLERPEERYEHAVRWVSYAMGIVLGRFKPGQKGELGSGIDEDGTVLLDVDFDKLNQLKDTDGIMALDQGHPDDLPARVEEALVILLGEAECKNLIDILGGDLRKFFEREFFTKWHIPMYKKRPVYWLLQTAKKSYGIYLFHEHLNADSIFSILEKYVKSKMAVERIHLIELKARVKMMPEGREKRDMEKDSVLLENLMDELMDFEKKIKAVQEMGYDPDIDDGVILNMGPLHELIPWAEPKKYWQELKEGKYDWAHMAMKYWPDRVKEKCRRDKSLAIAHGLED